MVQKYMFIPMAKKQFTLDGPIIYYTIIFCLNGSPICVCENIQIDSRMYDININYKHAVTAINSIIKN